ncbi:MAG: hypothetical protein [Caudoviricetes sp.]|nr:MAG: hypothetical protein [Caudoviricetes sp.]
MAIDSWRWGVQVQNGGGAIRYQDRVRSAQFGDGYSQATPEGMNPTSLLINIVYTGSAANVAQVVAFLNSHKTTPFTFAPPGGVLGLYTVQKDSVNQTPISRNVRSVTATFETNYGFY